MFSFFRSGKQSMTLAEITDHLNELRLPTALVFTPINLIEEKDKFLASETYNPQFKYRIVKNRNEEILKRLSSVKEIKNVDPRISDFYVELIGEKKEANDLLYSVGNNDAVTHISIERFGFPSAKLFRNASRILRKRVSKYNLISKEKTLSSDWIGFDEMKRAIEMFFKEVGLDEWTVTASQNIAKNGVKVGIKRREVLLSKDIKKRRLHVRRTIVHEICTHIFRTHNGFQSGYNALGQPNILSYLDVEEGLATWNEEKAGLLGFSRLRKNTLGAWAIYVGVNFTFRELFNALNGIVPQMDAFDIAYRVKRGLGDTSAPGIYSKDVVYLRGFKRVRARLEKDASLYKKLYAGKIGFNQVSWVDDGLIPQPKLLPDFAQYNKIFEKAGI